jgi:endonuclease VIII
MPEGDTIYGAAQRIRRVLVGKEIASIETHQRFARDRWPERLDGRGVRAVDTKGKHLFIRFEGDLTLHSHLRMNGWWGVYERGRRWGRSPSRAWLVIRTANHEVVQFGGPVLELMTDSRSRFDHRIARLGPDILQDEFDETLFLRRLREDDQSRGIADALLDQRNVCGIGNLWKAEACFLAGLDPWRPLAATSDEEALAAVHAVRPLMLRSGQGGGHVRDNLVFDRAGRPCRRCGTLIRARGQGDDNRTTYWCPKCQA